MISRLTIILFLFTKIYSQPFIFNPNKIGFTYQNIKNGFAGGIDNPRFQFCDIDNDKDNDLFLFDRDSHLHFYESINGKLVYVPYGNFGIYPGTWFRLYDIDGDTKLDFITNSILASVLYFKNISTTNKVIYDKTPIIFKDTLGNTLISEPYSMPTFADIDADYDLDFFTGSSVGQITFYKNIGDKNNPKFKYVTDRFQDLFIRGDGLNNINNIKHGASAIEFFDADSNGTLDLFWGDYFNKSIYFLKNIGTPQNAKLILNDSTFPKPEPVITMGFNQIQHIDFDNDTFTDMIVGVLFPIQNLNSFIFCKNVGTNKNPQFEIITREIIPMIDVGAKATITQIDIENDGDYDFFLGAEDGAVSLLKNIGTKIIPQFILEKNLISSNQSNFYSTPTVGDLNNDGLKELIAGNYFGTLKTYQINIIPQIEIVQKPFQLDTIDFGKESAPLLYDFNRDNILDLIVGLSSGKLIYLQNNGTISHPNFVKTNFSLDTLKLNISIIPTALDYNSDGKPDLLISTGDNRLLLFLNTSTTNYLEFKYAKSSFDSVSVYMNYYQNQLNKNYDDRYLMNLPISSSLVDIDNDKDLDLFIGSLKGGIYYFENKRNTSNLNQNKIELNRFTIENNYPNPFNSNTIIKFNLPFESDISISVYNLLGQLLLNKSIGYYETGQNTFTFASDELQSGIYFVKLISKNNYQTINSNFKTIHLIK